MKPSKFDESNAVLARPEGMSEEECGDLPVYHDPQFNISCWKLTWRERISALFFGTVWLWVYGGGHPPVALEARKTTFKKVHHHHE